MALKFTGEKAGAKIQYLNGSTERVVTGLTSC